MNLEQCAYTLPSGRAFVDTIGNDVGGGVTVVLIPDNLSRETVGRCLRDRFGSLNLRVSEIFRPGDADPVKISADAMRVRWPSGRTRRNVRNLLMLKDLPQVLYVHQIAAEDAESGRPWIEFMVDWAHESTSRDTSTRSTAPLLCVIAKLRDFHFQLPAVDSGLRVRWWWGFPSVLEMRVACRVASRINNGRDVASRWREHVLPNLVASDVRLGEHLWGVVTEDAGLIIRHLAEYWETEGQASLVDSINDLVELVKADANSYGIGKEVPIHLRRVWAGGGLVYTPEHGLEIHPALLAFAGRHSDVEHIIWRGQSELLLPILNEVRLRVCEAMTDAYGEDWPLKWWKPQTDYELDEVRASALAAQLGQIDYMLRNVGRWDKSHPLEQKRHLAKLVLLAKDLRNQIAHYSPVPFDQFIGLCEERKRVGI